MQLRSGHVTLQRAEFQPNKFFSKSDVRRRAASRWAVLQISSFNFFSKARYLPGVNKPIQRTLAVYHLMLKLAAAVRCRSALSNYKQQLAHHRHEHATHSSGVQRHPRRRKMRHRSPWGTKIRTLRGRHVKYVTTRPPSPRSLVFQFLKSS